MHFCGGMAEWLKAAVLKTVFRRRNVGSNPTPSARNQKGEMAELAEGARLLSECAVKAAPRVRIPLSPPSILPTNCLGQQDSEAKFEHNTS